MLVIIVGGIPIAMPTVLSVTLALGAFKLAKDGAIVARMSAVEEMAGTVVTPLVAASISSFALFCAPMRFVLRHWCNNLNMSCTTAAVAVQLHAMLSLCALRQLLCAAIVAVMQSDIWP